MNPPPPPQFLSSRVTFFSLPPPFCYISPPFILHSYPSILPPFLSRKLKRFPRNKTNNSPQSTPPTSPSPTSCPIPKQCNTRGLNLVCELCLSILNYVYTCNSIHTCQIKCKHFFKYIPEILYVRLLYYDIIIFIYLHKLEIDLIKFSFNI